jgi:hypothetical protein
MVYGELEIKYHPLDGIPPVRIDMKAEQGGHFLDVVTAVSDLEQLQGRDTDVEWIVAEGKDSKNSCDSPAKCNMVKVETETAFTVETATDSNELMEFEEYQHVRMITTDDRYRVTCAKTEVLTETERKAKEFSELEACMKELERVTEDSNCTEEERQRAFRKMEYKMDEIDRYRRFYTAQKKDIDRCMAVRTRSRTIPEQPTESAPVETEKSEKVEENIYEDYDKEHKAVERSKRRVRFEEFIQSEGDRKLIQEHIQQETRERKPKGQTTSQKEKQQERTAKAVAEAERRGATKADREERAAREIQEQQHDLFKQGPTIITKDNIQVYKEDDFSAITAIKDASDFTLATYLMENKVPL